jgi:predicted dehydrogenase
MSGRLDPPVRLASIGVGYWGATLADAVVASQSAEIVTCFAPTQAHCEEFAERRGCGVAPSYEAVLADPAVEGVVLATPNDVHRYEIELAARHGKHVFVEKPIALTAVDGQAATRACAEAHVVLAVGHQSRREPGARQLRTLIDAGELGEIVGVEANISTDTGHSVTPDTWRWSREQCPGGPLIQIGIHHIDTLCYLLGPIDRVFGLQRHRLIAAPIDDVTVTLLEFRGGVIGHLTSHYATARTIDIRVMGTKGVATYDRGLGLRLRRDTRARIVEETIPLPAIDPLVEEMTEFARCIRRGDRPEVGGEEATLALAVVLAAIESGVRGASVRIDEFLSGGSHAAESSQGGVAAREDCGGRGADDRRQSERGARHGQRRL